MNTNGNLVTHKAVYDELQNRFKSALEDDLNTSNALTVLYDVLKEEIISIIGEGKEASNWFLYTPLLKRIIENAIIDAGTALCRRRTP